MLILGANMPDIDIFFGRIGWEPLAMHRGFTHSLVGGLIVMPPLLVGLLLLLDRWQVGRGATFKSGLPMRTGWLLGLAYLATLTHPLMDLLTTYSVQLLSPFSNTWFHADALFIIDVWIWLVLGGSIVWSRIREDQGRPWQRPAQALATRPCRIPRRHSMVALASACRRRRGVDPVRDGNEVGERRRSEESGRGR